MEDKITDLLESDSWENKLLGMQLAKSQSMEDFLMKKIIERDLVSPFKQKSYISFCGLSLYIDSVDYISEDDIKPTIKTRFVFWSQHTYSNRGFRVNLGSRYEERHVYFDNNTILNFFENLLEFKIKESN